MRDLNSPSITTPQPAAQPAAQPEVEQPGLSSLRSAVANRSRVDAGARPGAGSGAGPTADLAAETASDSPPASAGAEAPGKHRLARIVGKDAIAGLSSAMSNVPDGLASGLLVGVNPVFGLYASIVGPIAGGVFASSKLMVITTTSAAALAAGQALGDLAGDARADALFIMVVLIGALQLFFGLLRLGRLTRFVSYSVMTGFLTGIAVLTALSQLPTVTRYTPSGGNQLTRTIDLLGNVGNFDLATSALAVLTLVMAIWLPRTRLGSLGTVLAVAVPSLLVFLLGSGIETVQDLGGIPRGLPLPHLPSLTSISLDTLTGAFAIAVIIVVQGAGVSQSVPNPGGSRIDVSRDFMAQGVANLAAGFFRGVPVGGSLGSTALNVLGGGRTRWAAVFSGVWIALIVLLIPGPMARVAMPSLGALLIVAAVSALDRSDIASVWAAGWSSRAAGFVTFAATLVLPIQVAVLAGVVLSAVLTLARSASDIVLIELAVDPEGRFVEQKLPDRLNDNDVTVLSVYGALFYAAARTLGRLLPDPQGATKPVVVLRLRGRTSAGATLVEVLSTYAAKLAAVGGRLYLSGLSESVHERLAAAEKLRLADPVHVYEMSPVLGASTREAFEDAQAWLVASRSGDGAPSDDD